MKILSKAKMKIEGLFKKGKGFFSVSGGKYVDAILGGVLWLLLIQFLSQSAYGSTVYWHSTALILTSISSLGFNLSFQTLIPKGETGIKKEGNALSLFFTVGLGIALGFVTHFNRLIPILYFFFLNRYKLSLGEILGEQNYQEFLYVSFGKRIIQLIASISLYKVMGVDGVLAGLTLGVALTSYRSLKNIGSIFDGFDFSITKTHLSFLLYTFAQTALIGIMGHIDRLVIGFMYGNNLLGMYAFVSQIFTFLRMIPGGFKGYLLPEKSAGRSVRLAETVGVLTSVGSGVATFLLAPFGISRFFPRFVEAMSAIRVISVTPFLFMITTILTTHYLSKEESQTTFFANVASNTVRIVSVFFLYRIFGVIGLGIALVLNTATTVLFLWMKKHIDLQLLERVE